MQKNRAKPLVLKGLHELITLKLFVIHIKRKAAKLEFRGIIKQLTVLLVAISAINTRFIPSKAIKPEQLNA